MSWKRDAHVRILIGPEVFCLLCTRHKSLVLSHQDFLLRAFSLRYSTEYAPDDADDAWGRNNATRRSFPWPDWASTFIDRTFISSISYLWHHQSLWFTTSVSLPYAIKCRGSRRKVAQAIRSRILQSTWWTTFRFVTSTNSKWGTLTSARDTEKTSAANTKPPSPRENASLARGRRHFEVVTLSLYLPEVSSILTHQGRKTYCSHWLTPGNQILIYNHCSCRGFVWKVWWKARWGECSADILSSSHTLGFHRSIPPSGLSHSAYDIRNHA